MHMKTLARLITLFMVALFVATAADASAQDRPRWTKGGTKIINRKRSNKSYEFVKFETFNPMLSTLHNERYNPLKAYIAKKVGISDTVDIDAAEVTLLTRDYIEGPVDMSDAIKQIQREVEIDFGEHGTYRARLVDEYVHLDGNVDETYDYTMWQLYQVATKPNTAPTYDRIDFTRSYRTEAFILSIIPGMGQALKGQYNKTAWILGIEAVSVGCALACNKKFHYFDKEAKKDDYIGKSYASKARSWRNFRNIAIGAGVVTYIVNLIDAAKSRGPRQVIVGGPEKYGNVAVGPTVLYDPEATVAAGVGLTWTF